MCAHFQRLIPPLLHIHESSGSLVPSRSVRITRGSLKPLAIFHPGSASGRPSGDLELISALNLKLRGRRLSQYVFNYRAPEVTPVS